MKVVAIYIKNIIPKNVKFKQFNNLVSTITVSFIILCIIITQKNINKDKKITINIFEIIVKYNLFFNNDIAYKGSLNNIKAILNKPI